MVETSLRQFQILQEVFRSTNGAVYKARRRYHSPGEIVCLKERRFAELGRKRDILNEVNLLQRAQSHPNLVKFHSHFWDHGTGALVMVLEYVSGGDLYSEIVRRRTLKQYFSEEVIWKLFYQICLGLNHLHRLGIIHRDLKTLNIMISKDLETAKIGDLGVSRQVSENTQFLKTFYGTPLYASPELCRNKPYNEKTDIWSLGVILYEMAALTQPFQSESLLGLAERIKEGVFAPIPSQYSPMMTQVVERLLQLDPDQRPSISTVLGFFHQSSPEQHRLHSSQHTHDEPLPSSRSELSEETADSSHNHAPSSPQKTPERSSMHPHSEHNHETDAEPHIAVPPPEPDRPSSSHHLEPPATTLSKGQRQRAEIELKRKKLHLRNLDQAIQRGCESQSEFDQAERLREQIALLQRLIERSDESSSGAQRPQTAGPSKRVIRSKEEPETTRKQRMYSAKPPRPSTAHPRSRPQPEKCSCDADEYFAALASKRRQQRESEPPTPALPPRPQTASHSREPIVGRLENVHRAVENANIAALNAQKAFNRLQAKYDGAEWTANEHATAVEMPKIVRKAHDIFSHDPSPSKFDSVPDSDVSGSTPSTPAPLPARPKKFNIISGMWE